LELVLRQVATADAVPDLLARELDLAVVDDGRHDPCTAGPAPGGVLGDPLPLSLPILDPGAARWELK
jgi:hypothetical protein